MQEKKKKNIYIHVKLNQMTRVTTDKILDYFIHKPLHKWSE